jgi:hypothetical protein
VSGKWLVATLESYLLFVIWTDHRRRPIDGDQ